MSKSLPALKFYIVLSASSSDQMGICTVFKVYIFFQTFCFFNFCVFRRVQLTVAHEGIELATLAPSAPRSNQLSYVATHKVYFIFKKQGELNSKCLMFWNFWTMVNIKVFFKTPSLLLQQYHVKPFKSWINLLKLFQNSVDVIKLHIVSKISSCSYYFTWTCPLKNRSYIQDLISNLKGKKVKLFLVKIRVLVLNRSVEKQMIITLNFNLNCYIC